MPTTSPMLIVAGALSGILVQTVAAQNADMVGTWTLNVEESDDPADALRRRRSASQLPNSNRGSQQERTRRRGRPGAAAGGPGGGMSEEQRAWMQAGMQMVRRNPPGLRISLTDSTVTVTQMQGREMILITDGEQREVAAPNGALIKIRAEWDSDKLKVETEAGDNISIVEQYEIKDDGRRLEVRVDFRNRQMNQRGRIKRVYGRRNLTGGPQVPAPGPLTQPRAGGRNVPGT